MVNHFVPVKCVDEDCETVRHDFAVVQSGGRQHLSQTCLPNDSTIEDGFPPSCEIDGIGKYSAARGNYARAKGFAVFQDAGAEDISSRAISDNILLLFQLD